MMNYEYLLRFYPHFPNGDILNMTTLDSEYPIDIDSDISSSSNGYKFAVDEITGVSIPMPGQIKSPVMDDDGIIQTPNGIKYQIINTRSTFPVEYIQYIQPDGRHATPGEAIKLPSGEVYRGKSGRVLYQQDPMISAEDENTLMSGETVEMVLEFYPIDDMEFDFGYKNNQ
jgi:hypothetical protein